MRIPYLQRVAVGLHLGVREVRWAELSLTFGGLPFERLRLRRYEVEPVVGGEQEAALGRLVERVQPRYRYVHSHVDPEQVRVHFLDAPAFDDDEDLQAWLAEQPARLLPVGSSEAEFVARAAVVAHREEGARCVVALARREVVEERLAMVERTGLLPLRIGTGLMEVSSAFVFEPAYEAAEPVLVYASEGRVVALRTRGGAPDESAVLADTSSPDLLAEVGVRLGEPIGEVRQREQEGIAVWVTGEDSDGVVTRSREGRARAEAQVVRPLSSALQSQVLLGEAALAAGLAVEGLYPVLRLLDLQSEEHVVQAHALREKEEAQGALLGMGLVLFALLLLASLATWGLGRQVGAAEVVLRSQAEGLEGLTQKQEQHAQLQSDLQIGHELIGERTDVARLMEMLGQAVPRGVWFIALRLESEESGGLRITVSGRTTDPFGVRNLLVGLEENDAFKGVLLVSTEQRSSEEAEGLVGKRMTLTTFSVTAVYDDR